MQISEDKKEWITFAVGIALMLAGIFIAWRHPVHAAEFGNTVYDSPTPHYFRLDGIDGSGGGQNSLSGALQTFTLSQTITTDGIALYLANPFSAAGVLEVYLCSTPDVTNSNPCHAGSIYNWHVNEASLPIDDGSHGDRYELAIPTTITLAQGTEYGIYIERAMLDHNNYIQVARNTGQYSEGAAKIHLNGSCTAPGWVWGGATSPSDCTSTVGDNWDILFTINPTSSDLSMTTQDGFPGDEDINVAGNCHKLLSGQSWASGYGAGGSPDYGKVKVTASKVINGTRQGFYFADASCTVDGDTNEIGYSQTLSDLAQGQWIFEVQQVTTSASGTATYHIEEIRYIESSTGTVGYINPAKPIVNFIPLSDCYDDNGDSNAIRGAFCEGMEMIAARPPFQWAGTIWSAWNDVGTSATSTVRLAVALPEGHEILILDSASSTAGAIGQMQLLFPGLRAILIGALWIGFMFDLWLERDRLFRRHNPHAETPQQ